LARISVVGSWHQAMVYGAGLADLGHRVRGICESAAVAEALNAARPVVYEPGLAALLRRNIKRRRLSYTADYHEGLAGAEFVYISIDTPVGPDDSSDVSSILDAARQIGRHLTRRPVICVTAQVPLGTCERIKEIVSTTSGHELPIAYVPEFLRLGTAIETFRRADRFVVGADDPRIAKRVSALYSALRRPLYVTDLRTAEMAKHASNAFLATSISFMNEIADLCGRTGADATVVAAIVKADRRVGPYAFLAPGLGYAGGTLGREIKALQHMGRETKVDTRLLDAVEHVNAVRPAMLVQAVSAALDGLSGRRIAVLGLTYKPGTSTMRRAISLEIIRDLVRGGATVAAFDPLADLSDVVDKPAFTVSPDAYEAAHQADAVIMITPWPGIERLDLVKLTKVMRGRVLFDTRNHFDPDVASRAGLTYRGIGRNHGRGARK